MKYNMIKQVSKKIKMIFSLAMLASVVFIISCEIPSDPLDILELRIDTNIFTHKGFISAKDTKNQANLKGNILKAKFTIGGSQPTDIIVTEGGLIRDVINLKDGIGAFAVNPKYRGFTEPIQIDVQIYGTNYLTKNISVIIRPQDSLTSIRTNVLNTIAVPSGVAVAQQSAPLAGGTNTTPVTVNTNTSTTNTTAQVTIPAGNTFNDAAGNAITSGNLSAQVVYFDGSDNGANSSSINGDVKTLVDENGATLSNVSIAPVATADINMTVGSTEVKQFGTPIEVTLDINGGFINPETGNSVKVGEVFNIYSTSDNGNWAYQAKGTVVSNNGKLQVTFPTDHLSTFTLGTVVNKCDINTSFIPLPNGGQGFETVYNGVFKKANGSTINTTTVSKTTISGISGLLIPNIPNEQANLVLTSQSNPSISIETGLLGWCTSQTALDADSLNGLVLPGVTVQVDISARCSGSSSIRPSGVVLYVDYLGDGNFTEIGVVQEGRISIPGITLNRPYKLRVYYDGDSGDGTYTFTSTNQVISDYELPGDVCTELGI